MTRFLVLILALVATTACGSSWPRAVWAEDSATPEQVRALHVAVSRWNSLARSELGHDVLVLAPGDVTVYFHADTTTEWWPCNRYTAPACAEIEGSWIHARWNPIHSTAELTHELGHILGLDDRYDDSTTDDGGVMGSRYGQSKFSDTDRINLRILAEEHQD